MKSPNFWKSISIFSLVLLPFSVIFYLVGLIRNIITAPYKAEIPVICVGNVTAGGGGKTPIALSIAKLLIGMNKSPMFLSRGYGGNLNVTTVINSDIHDAKQTGDEPLLLSNVAHTVVSKNRVSGAKLICQKDADIIVMDDGLQNPTLHKNLSILVIDGIYGIGNGNIIPAGPMRETLSSALKKSDAVIFIGEDRTGLLPRLKGNNIIKANIVTNIVADKDIKYVAFAGIANPSKFFKTLNSNNFNVVKEISYGDHYQYEDEDIAYLNKIADQHDAKLITTEKDYVRMLDNQRDNIVMLPIEIQWEDEEQVIKLLRSL